MNVNKQTLTFDSLGIFFCGLILFTAGLGQQEIIGFETRFFLFAKEMWVTGLSWFPTTYFSPYPDYPVTPTLFIYFFSKLMGHLNKFTAVFPSAVAAAVTLVVTYLIGALQSRQWGLLAVFFLLLTNTFLLEARTIAPDQYVTMVTAICFYLIYSSKVLYSSQRLWWLPLLFAFGFACRGPIGLVVPAGVVCVFYLLDKDFKNFFILGLVALLVLVAGSLALFAAAYHVGGWAFVQDVLQMQVAGRLQDAHLPWYFYLVESLGGYAITYPLVILIVASLGNALIKNTDSDMALMQKLLGWALIILIGLTLPAGKKTRYILAFAPALALMSAYLFVGFPHKKYFLLLKKLSYSLIFILPSLCFLAAATILLLSLKNISALNPLFSSGIAFHLPFMLFVFFALQCVAIVYRKQNVIVIGVASLSFVLAYVALVEPINLALNRTRNFVEAVELSRHIQGAKLVFYREGSDALVIKYVVDMPKEEQPMFVREPEELMKLGQDTFIVTEAKYFAALPEDMSTKFKMIFTGNLGHVPVVVINRK